MPKVVYKNIEYDSDEEVYFSMWLEEAQDAGLVKSWEKNTKSYLLCPQVINEWEKVVELKKSTRRSFEEQKILNGSEYTPDFNAQWTRRAGVILFQRLFKGNKIVSPFIISNCENEKFKSIVEVKPSFDRNNMTRLFVNNQKFMWFVYGIYINKIIPQKLFEHTFTPEAFCYTIKTGKKKELKWVKKTVKHFINDAR